MKYEDNVSSHVHKAAKDFFQEDSICTEGCRNIRHATQVVVLKWWPFKTMKSPIVAMMEYDDREVFRLSTVEERRVWAQELGKRMCLTISFTLEQWEKHAQLWEEYQARIYNRFWRRAWRNIIARWPRHGTPTSRT